MNRGRYAFVLVIPGHFQRDLAAWRRPQLQLNIDATVVSQAFIGAGYINHIVVAEIDEVLQVPIAGSLALFLTTAVFYLFAAASIGIFLGTLARSMPQLGLLIIITVVPLQRLSGGVTPQESMPAAVQNIMAATPTNYFVRLAQGILYRGTGFDLIWRDLLTMTGVGACFFTVALLRFRRAVTQTQV